MKSVSNKPVIKTDLPKFTLKLIWFCWEVLCCIMTPNCVLCK